MLAVLQPPFLEDPVACHPPLASSLRSWISRNSSRGAGGWAVIDMRGLCQQQCMRRWPCHCWLSAHKTWWPQGAQAGWSFPPWAQEGYK